MKVLLDTHILLWWLLDVPKLSKTQKKILDEVDAGKSQACISVMSLWEISTLYSLGRLHFDFPFRDWLRSIYYHESLEIIALDADIIFTSTELRKELPGDPVDQILVATAKLRDLPLVTSDTHIRKVAGIAVI